MRVLIIGDFSSSGHFLAQGFKGLGIDVTHVAYQNGWRENPIEINLTSKYSGIIGRFDNYFKPFRLQNLKGYDAVIFIDYFAFPRTFGINSIITRQIQENSKESYLWVMGCDSKLREWGKEKNFDLCNPCLMYDQKSLKCRHENDLDAEQKFLLNIKSIIPATFEYHEAHKLNPKIGPMIQLPILNTEGIRPYNKGLIKVFHGLNRYGFKGTHIVERVFNEMEIKYKDDVSFLIKGKLPFIEYTKLTSQQDVIVDQLFSQCLGINGLLTLAQGKVLIAGDPSPTYNILKFPNPPMIATEPSLAGLKRSLEYLIENKHNLKQYQEEGPEYIKKYHAPGVVARKFLDVFGW